MKIIANRAGVNMTFEEWWYDEKSAEIAWLAAIKKSRYSIAREVLKEYYNDRLSNVIFDQWLSEKEK